MFYLQVSSRRPTCFCWIFFLYLVSTCTTANSLNSSDQESTCSTKGGGTCVQEERESSKQDGQSLRIDIDWGVTQLVLKDLMKDETLASIKKANDYMTNEVLVKPKYVSVRDKCKDEHESCAYWAAIGA